MTEGDRWRYGAMPPLAREGRELEEAREASRCCEAGFAGRIPHLDSLRPSKSSPYCLKTQPACGLLAPCPKVTTTPDAVV